MKIDEEIKQEKGFSSPYQKAVINTMFTANWAEGQIKSILKPYGITNQQYNVLRILRGAGPDPCSSSYVKERMIDRQPDLTRLLDRLIKKGYVNREICPENRRQLDITISEKGLELLESSEEPIKQMNNNNKLTEAESMQLSDLLDKMRG